MVGDENPLDRISAGPPPTGPTPWRSDRLPTGSPHARGRRSPLRPGDRRGLGRFGKTVLIVAVTLVAGILGWAAFAPTRTAESGESLAEPAAPPVPTVDQIAVSPLFTTPLSAPACPLPAWSTDPAAAQAFTVAANACLEQIWGLQPYRVETFATADDVPPGSTCPPGSRVENIAACEGVVYLNLPRATQPNGDRAGAVLQWISHLTASRASTQSGVSSDVGALVDASGGPDTPRGIEIRKREHMQNLCLSGATLARIVGGPIDRGELEQAAVEATTWSILGPGSAAEQVSPLNTRAWFDRGSRSPGPEPCGAAWTAPVAEIA